MIDTIIDAKKSYAAIIIAALALFAHAVIRTSHVSGRRHDAFMNTVETVSPHEAAERFAAIEKDFETPARSAKEYFAVLEHAYVLTDIALKLRERSKLRFSDQEHFLVIDAPIRLQEDIRAYQQKNPAFDWRDIERERNAFAARGHDPLHRPHFEVAGADQLWLWWTIAWFGTALLMVPHFGIQIRRLRMNLLLEWANPMFPVWAIIWPVGLFRYPMKVSVGAQLRRARAWATMVLSSSLSLCAGTGKVCEEKREKAPQYQKYDGLLRGFSLSTGTFSNYVGLDGGVFFPGVVQWTTAAVQLPCGFYLTFFDSEPLTERGLRPNFGWELDYAGGWSRAFGPYAVDASATYINAFPLTQMPRGDVLQLSERVARNLEIRKGVVISPYLWTRQAMPLRGPTPNGGHFEHIGSSMALRVNPKVTLNGAAEVLHDSGAFGFHAGAIGRVMLGLSWTAKDGVTIQAPQITFDDPVSHTGDGRHPTVSVGASVSFTHHH